ncbi:RecN ATPase involved in DNA repair [Candidatus Nanopelagicaceae bacterium]
MSERTYLEEISIRNLGIIEESHLELGNGLNVLTGETGAGKTMILTALNLVLGGKSDSSLVRSGSDRLTTTATFAASTKPSHELATALESSDLSIEDSQIIFSRSVTAEGKSKALCNGTTVPASVLSDLSVHLIEIHGQSANTQLVKSARQRELLDRFGGTSIASQLATYSENYGTYLELKNRIKAMQSASSARDKEIADLEDFLSEWSKLKPTRGEYAATVDEISRLSSVEDLRVAAAGAAEAASDEESGALTALGAAKRFLENAKGRDSRLDAISDQVSESFYALDEAARDLSSYLSSLEADPDRLNALQERRAQLSAFVKKWGSGADPDVAMVDLAARAKSGRENIADLRGGDERVKELEGELSAIKKDLVAAAEKLSDARRGAARELSLQVSVELKQLSMPHTELIIDIETPDLSGALKESDFNIHGCDEVSISIKAHATAAKVPIGKGASGGEMSRIILALEVVIAKTHPVGTYIFDEVDAGVGGKAAIEVGRRLHLLAQSAQVIVVTHLPQVAAWADTHFRVEKRSDGSIVESGVEKLSESQRVEEIARMLAGLEESTSALEHAAELLSMRGSAPKR